MSFYNVEMQLSNFNRPLRFLVIAITKKKHLATLIATDATGESAVRLCSSTAPVDGTFTNNFSFDGLLSRSGPVCFSNIRTANDYRRAVPHLQWSALSML